MQRILTPIALLLTLAASAQQRPVAVPEHPIYKHGYRAPGVPVEPSGERGSAFYLEAFDSNLNGWTVSTPTGIVQWKWTNGGPGPTPSTYPVPPLNTTTPSGWAIIDDDFDGVAGQSTVSSLISPVIDLSDAPANLKVEFEQYFQEFQLDQTFVGVSTDGGTTWNETEINIGVGRDGRPNPELVDVNISPWVAANPANVQLRFRYVSTWDYGWQVDNIAIRELPFNDMAIVRTSTTAYDFDLTEFENMDYSIYPVSQLASLAPRATVKNKGFDTQTGVTVNLLVQGPSGTVADYTSSASNYAQGAETELPLSEFTLTAEPGLYTLNYTVDQDQVDEIPQNNTFVSTVEVSTNVYAHDDGSVDNFQTQAAANAGDAFEVGNYFVLLQNAFVVAIQVAVHENTPVGGSVYGAVYLPSASNDTHPELLELTASHVITGDDLNPIGGNTFITLPFQSPFQLEAGQPYLVVGGSFDGLENIHFATSGLSAPQVSNIHYPDLSTSFQFYITRTPMVRLLISDNVGIADRPIQAISGVALHPNPLRDQTTVNFTLANAAATTLMVTDAMGRVVLREELGLRTAGEHRHVVNGLDLAPGTYLCTLMSGHERMVRRMVITH